MGLGRVRDAVRKFLKDEFVGEILGHVQRLKDVTDFGGGVADGIPLAVHKVWGRWVVRWGWILGTRSSSLLAGMVGTHVLGGHYI